MVEAVFFDVGSVSYTHLDVYKRQNYDDTRINNALLQLASALALDEPPMRIECFDLSTIHGSYTAVSYTHLDVYKRQR